MSEKNKPEAGAPAEKTTQTTPEATMATPANVKKAPVVAKRNAKAAEAAQQDPEEKIESAINRTEEFLFKNGKTLLTALAIIVIVIGGYLAYKYLYIGSRGEKAGAEMFMAEQLFDQDEYDLALNGDGNNIGFLDIISKYGNTPQGNIAKHYAGVCMLHLGDLDSALDYLGRYSTSSGAPNEIVNAQNLGLQGDIFVQKGDYNKAIDKFKAAVDASDNSFTAPVYLKKLGLAYDKTGRHDLAVEAFRRVGEEYPASMEARDIEKYIGAQEQK